MIGLLWFLIVALAVASQWYIIEKKKIKPNKPFWFAIRIIVATGFFLLFQNAGYDPVWSISFMIGAFWGPFNEFLNWRRDKPMGYLGDDWVDRIIKKILPDPMIVFTAELLLFLWGVGTLYLYSTHTSFADLF